MTPPRPSEPLTPRQAAAALGWGSTRAAGRRLARRIGEKETSTGAVIFSRTGGTRGACRLVTLAALRRHMSELFDHREQVAAMLRDSLDALVARLDAQDIRMRVLAGRLRQCLRGLAELRAALATRPK